MQNYRETKEKGNTEIQVSGDHFKVMCKRFCELTGDDLGLTQQGIYSVADITGLITNLDAQLKDFRAIKADGVLAIKEDKSRIKAEALAAESE